MADTTVITVPVSNLVIRLALSSLLSRLLIFQFRFQQFLLFFQAHLERTQRFKHGTDRFLKVLLGTDHAGGHAGFAILTYLCNGQFGRLHQTDPLTDNRKGVFHLVCLLSACSVPW